MGYKYSIISALMFLTASLYYSTQGFAQVLNTADKFAVLGGTTVTSTGATAVTGDLGVDPGSSITGFGPGTVDGTIYGPDAVTVLAQSDATAAYNGLVGMSSTSLMTGVNLGGLTLTPGVFTFATSAQLTGPLILNAQDFNNADFVFQIGTTLTTASNSSVTLINQGTNDGVFWQVGSSATLGTGTMFTGNLLSDQSITLTNGVDVNGRVIALNGEVTMDDNNVNSNVGNNGFDAGIMLNNGQVVAQGPPPLATPEPATLSLLGLGLIGLRFNKKIN